jgi:hypothetical protein
MTRDEVLDIIAEAAERTAKSLRENAALPENQDTFADPPYIAECLGHLSVVAEEMRQDEAAPSAPTA